MCSQAYGSAVAERWKHKVRTLLFIFGNANAETGSAPGVEDMVTAQADIKTSTGADTVTAEVLFGYNFCHILLLTYFIFFLPLPCLSSQQRSQVAGHRSPSPLPNCLHAFSEKVVHGVRV